MANYGRMDIMSMSDEEIERILKEEEETLEDYELALLFEELRNRRECAFSPKELPDEEDLLSLEESEDENDGEDEVEERDEEDEKVENCQGENEESGKKETSGNTPSSDSPKKTPLWLDFLIGGLCIVAVVVFFLLLTRS